MDLAKPVGKIKTIKSTETDFMKFGIGLEKLDRNVFDPSKTYDKLHALGVKRVRIQSGWMRTEKKEGVFDFAWLDEIVDNLLSRGMKPWMCLCYGNPLYTESARVYYGGVGCPPVKTETERKAWARYCEALAEHYKGRVDEFEVWNEPDGKHCWKEGVNGKQYGEFVINSARAVKRANPEAQIFAGSCCARENLSWFEAMLKTGAWKYIDAITYHDYCETETRCEETARAYRLIAHKYNPDIKMIMGETGSPSVPYANGALCRNNWSESKQAKLLLRRMITEMKNGLEFISWFTTVDMVEALHGTYDDKASNIDYGYFGVLRATFDENGFSTGDYEPKPSYYALRNFCAAFDKAECAELPIIFGWKHWTDKSHSISEEYASLSCASFTKPNGSCAFAYWKPVDILTSTFEGFATVIADVKHDKMRLVDLLDGTVYDVSAYVTEDSEGVVRLNDLPVKEYPLLLTFGDFLEETRL